ncbi:MAG: FmdB family transcriptional regulator [Actinobacteria bacterium]|nr:FmdB family transcriptional regulator [Actinomycetota bacterium]
MPTYQYACTECGERLEVVQKFTDDPLTVCDACGGKLRKVFSAVGIVFKGSGFYRTDSRNGAEADSKGKHGDKEAAKDSKPSGSGGASGSKSGSSDSSGSSGSAGSSGSSGDKAAAGSKNGSAGSSSGSSSGSASSGAKVA